MVQHSSSCMAGIPVIALISGADAFSCTEALTGLAQCRSFLMGNGQITISCCQGVHSLRQAAAAQTDKNAICRCLTQAALSAKVSLIKVEGLLPFCRINVPGVIDPSFDCNAIRSSSAAPSQQKSRDLPAISR